MENDMEDAVTDRDDIVVISGDDVRDANRCIEQLKNETVFHTNGQFISIAAGGGGLNFIHELEPERIIFFDANEHALDWLKFILYLIHVCPDRLSFVQSLFSRSAATLPTTPSEADAFLRQLGSMSRWQAVHDAIDDTRLADVHDHYGRLLMEAPAGSMILPFGRCNGLSIPELPNSNFIGLMQDPEMAYPDNYRCVNLNDGWLATEETYAKTRTILDDVKMTFHIARFGDLPMGEWSGDVEWSYVYVSNQNGLNPDEWISTLVKWKIDTITAFPLSRVVLMTACDGATDVINDPLSKLNLNRSSTMNRVMAGRGSHFQAWQAITSRIKGKNVCELVHDQSLGFSEIDGKLVLFKDFHAAGKEFDTVIMHTPRTTGVSPGRILDCIARSLHMQARVILFDHNPECGDFQSSQVANSHQVPIDEWWTLESALKKIKPTLPDDTLIDTLYTGNFSDTDRNWFIILDPETVEPDRMLAKRDLDSLVHDLRLDHMRQYKVNILNHYAAKAFKDESYDSVVLAAMEAHFLAPGDLAVSELYCWAMCYIGQPDLAAAAITLAARMHGEITEEMEHLAEKFGFIIRLADKTPASS